MLLESPIGAWIDDSEMGQMTIKSRIAELDRLMQARTGGRNKARAQALARMRLRDAWEEHGPHLVAWIKGRMEEEENVSQ